MRFWEFLCGSVLAAPLLCAGMSAYAEAPEPGTTIPDDRGTVSLMVENDLFGSGTDRHFTHGMAIGYTTREYLPSETDPIAVVANLNPFWPTGARARATYSLGQNMYTPEDITNPNPIPTDRPYAGWLYFGAGLIAAAPDASRSDTVLLEVGVVGPASLASKTHMQWHKWFDFTEPRGWDNQLKNEPGFNIVYEHTQRLWQDELMPGLNMDLVPNSGFSLGNIQTYLSGGATLRLGRDLTTDMGPPRIRPSLPGSAYIRPTNGFNWYVFTSAGTRLVLRNIFLDGNTFRDSQSVDKRYLVADLQSGLALQYGDWRMTYTYVIRTKEFEQQDKIDKWGAISLSYRF